MPKRPGPPTKHKTKRSVRFLITEGGDVVSESVRFEKHGMPRSKATEAVECLLAGNERFRKVITSTLDWAAPPALFALNIFSQHA